MEVGGECVCVEVCEEEKEDNMRENESGGSFLLPKPADLSDHL